jgi:hypothetical protein
MPVEMKKDKLSLDERLKTHICFRNKDTYLICLYVH